MDDRLANHCQRLIRKAPSAWLAQLCAMLRQAPATAHAADLRPQLPGTRNADLALTVAALLDAAVGHVTWEALGFAIELTHATYVQEQRTRHIEMLWSGPAPAHHLPARRIDQALYDLIAAARRDIWLVTFAAANIQRLGSVLQQAHARGVKIRLVLEFAQTSQGQLSFDALRAFAPELAQSADIYCWPTERRARNPAGRPGKLHAKLAVVDDVVLVSSANLTDDAFNRNLEIGVMLHDPAALAWASAHLQGLIQTEVLQRVPAGRP